MALIRWNPWNLKSLIDEDFELPTAFSRFGLGQGLNLYETEDEIVAEAALPGVPEDRIDITVDNGLVRITGSTEENIEEKGKRRYYMSAMSGSYNYSFRVPEGIVADEEPTAEVSNGVLILRFLKVQKSPPKKVQVKKTEKTVKK